MKKILIAVLVIGLPVLGYAASPVIRSIKLGEAAENNLGRYEVAEGFTYFVDRVTQLCFARAGVYNNNGASIATVDCGSLRAIPEIDEFLKSGKEL